MIKLVTKSVKGDFFMDIFSKKIKGAIIATTLCTAISSALLPFPSVYAEDESLEDESSEDQSQSGGTATNEQKLEQIQKVLGVTAGGNSYPVPGSNARYSWQYIKNLPPEVGGEHVPICLGTKTPTQNEAVSYKCTLTMNHAYGYTTVSGTAMGGEQTLNGMMPIYYTYVKKDSNGKPITKKGMAVMAVSVTINAYRGETSLTGGQSPFDSFNTGGGDSNLWGNDSDTYDEDDSPSGSYECPDGSFSCSSPDGSSTLFPNGTGTGGNSDSSSWLDGWGTDGSGNGSNDGTEGGGNSWLDNWGNSSSNGTGMGDFPSTDNSSWFDNWGKGGNGSSDGGGSWFDKWGEGEDNPWGSNSSSGSNNYYPYDSSSDRNYADALNDLLNDSGKSYNGDDGDWGDTNGGGDGFSDLDDYFNGLDDSKEFGEGTDGMTDDLTGVDPDLLNAAGESNQWGQSEDGSEGDGSEGDGSGESLWENTEGNDGSGSEEDFFSDPTQDLFNVFDGSAQRRGGSSDTLSGQLQGILDSVKTKVMGGNPAEDSNEQALYLLAKDYLEGKGYSLDDILHGKNYDKGSAYTEPTNAWDMNRITKLLKEKKIKLDGSPVEQKKEKSSLGNAAKRNNKVHDNAAKK